jgi:hypothetical protein
MYPIPLGVEFVCWFVMLYLYLIDAVLNKKGIFFAVFYTVVAIYTIPLSNLHK